MAENAVVRAGGVPPYEVERFFERRNRFALVIPVFNEGDRIRLQLRRCKPFTGVVDIIIADGGSTDGAVHPSRNEALVRSLVRKTNGPGLSSQLRCGFHHALDDGYDGIITVDGNGKDDLSSLPLFIGALSAGFDFVQGSRFVLGGVHQNTPSRRLVGIRMIHAPVVSLLARVRYTDTTNGFRGHSRALLSDERVAVFRDVFEKYELLPYLAVRSARLGLRVCEVPVARRYPEHGAVPTKMDGIRAELRLLAVLARLARGRYDPIGGR